MQSFNFFSFALAALGLGFGWLLALRAYRNIRFQLLIKDITTSKVRNLVPGLVELRGQAEPLEPMSDPLFQEPCSFYRITVVQSQSTCPTHKPVATELADTSRQKFWLRDDTGRILVDPKGARTIYSRTLRFAAGQCPVTHPVERYIRGIPGIGPEGWTLQATIVRPQDHFYVLGHAVPIDGTQPGRMISISDIPLREFARLLKASPQRMKTLDADENGVVDPQEWEGGLAKLRQELAAREAGPQAAATPIAAAIIREAPDKPLILCDDCDPRIKGPIPAAAAALRSAAAVAVILLSLRIMSGSLGPGRPHASRGLSPEAQPSAPAPKAVDLERVIRLTSPQDSDALLPEQDEEGSRLPSFQNPVRFTWEQSFVAFHTVSCRLGNEARCSGLNQSVHNISTSRLHRSANSSFVCTARVKVLRKSKRSCGGAAFLKADLT